MGKEHDLPVVTLAIPQNSLTGAQGVLNNIEMTYEYEGQLTLIEDGQEKFSIPCGFRLHGNDSRKGDKQNFQLRFRGEYGATKLEYRLFEDRDIDTFDSLLLKGGSEDWYKSMIRDELGSAIADSGMNLYAQATKPVVLYLGDRYWGIYYLRERYSADYVASHLGVSEEMTPTLYSMMHEGFYFTDYYVPDWGVSTTDGEYAHLTGTIPKDGVWSFKRSSGNYMPLTMNQQLLKLGYNSYAYHGHTHTYYGRDQYLGNLGYNYKGLGGGLEVKKTWPESDVEVVDLSTADFVGQQPFSVYYMTISGHREFNFSGNSMAAKNKELVADLPYSNNVRAYIATQLELEHSMGLLLQRLEEAGVLDNTVIVLTADHYPNGLTAEEMGELLGHTPEGNFEIYRNGCIIWKPGMTPEVIDEPMSHLDLLPTVSNLFGLEFDSRLYMGRDVFSDAEPLVMFRNRSWITGDARYNSQTGKAEFFSGAESSEYVKAINTEVGNRFAVSTRILENDYWRILFQ